MRVRAMMTEPLRCRYCKAVVRLPKEPTGGFGALLGGSVHCDNCTKRLGTLQQALDAQKRKAGATA